MRLDGDRGQVRAGDHMDRAAPPPPLREGIEETLAPLAERKDPEQQERVRLNPLLGCFAPDPESDQAGEFVGAKGNHAEKRPP